MEVVAWIDFYFVHEFKPKFIESGLFAHPELLAEVTRINKQIQSLAPILNSPTVKDAVTVRSSEEKVPIDVMVKSRGGETYIFAVSMRDAPAKASFEVKKEYVGNSVVEVLGEETKHLIVDGKFQEDFKGYEVKLYKIN